MDLELLKLQHYRWLDQNFPDQTHEDAFMGVVEEVGELAHVILKHKQQIREFADKQHAQEVAADCVGDIIIFLDGFCRGFGLSLPQVVSETWKDVKQRDWIKFPKDGLTK